VCDDAGAANQRYAVVAADGVDSGAWTPKSEKTRQRIGARVMLQVRNRKKREGEIAEQGSDTNC